MMKGGLCFFLRFGLGLGSKKQVPTRDVNMGRRAFQSRSGGGPLVASGVCAAVERVCCDA